MMNDAACLQEYAANGSEDAFATLVQRYLPLVYAAALRRVGGDTHRAQDVAQLAFTALARNARSLVRHPDLTGWLFTTTRFLAAKTVRGEVRRQAREQEAGFIGESVNEPTTTHSPAALQVVLDDVLMELRQLDLQVILLRFHRGLRFAEIGAQLGTSENAVQKRLDRALDLLRAKLARRGITSTAAALAVAFEQPSTIALPAGLAAAATAAGLTCGAGAGSLLAISTVMTLSKLQLGLAVALLAGLSTGLVWNARENTRLSGEIAAQTEANTEKTALLRRQLAQFAQRADAAEADLVALLRAVQATKTPPAARTTAGATSSTRDRTLAIIVQANRLTQEGKPNEAMALFLKYYRELGAQRVFTADQQMIIGQLRLLGETFPPARAALHALREDALRTFRSRPELIEPLREIATIDARLGDGGASIALYDTLPADDPGRDLIAIVAQAAFVEARRYADAVKGVSYATMQNMLNVAIHRHAATPDHPVLRESVISTALMNIEALAGAGRREEANKLIEKLTTYDASSATRSAVQQRLDRAGQPPTK